MTYYTTRNQARLVFDIETAANPENLSLMPEPKAPGNLKDPAKIAAAIEEKKAEAIASAALDPDYGKVLSIGMATEGGITVMVNKTIYPNAPGAVEESAMLGTFWQELAWTNGYCIGYNILGFDLPYLMRRSMALGVKPTLFPNLAKFRTDPVTDLMAILYNWGSTPYKGLKTVAKLYRLPVECPDVDGSMVANMDAETLIKYQRSDVALTMSLYQIMNGVYFSH